MLVDGVGDSEAAIAPLEAAHQMRPDDNRVVNHDPDVAGRLKVVFRERPAIAIVLTPIFDPTFSESSFGFHSSLKLTVRL